MYRCRECKTEYKTKVEYCECGNNTFEYIEDKIPQQRKSMTLEQKSELVSKLFFVLCILISVIVWLIPVKSGWKKAPSVPKTTKPAVTAPIPDIDKIWNDTPAYVPKPLQPEVINRTEPIPLTSSPDKSDGLLSGKPAQNSVKKNSLNQSVSKPAEYEIVYNPPPVSKKKEVTQQPKRVVEPTKPSYNPNSPAMLKYKGDLRAALFSKFAAGTVQGSGSCEISFSVDKTGKLINRKFTRESDNKTLNDVVYYMLMSVPKYLPPPSEYNGETIRMKFVIENGSYEITIN